MDNNLLAFGTFAIASQAVLLIYFATRRLRASIADRYGWFAYALGLLGLPLGWWLFADGAPWQLYAGPILFAAWSTFGGWADRIARIEWRQPIRWTVLGPYVFLYLAAQMFLWWPLWDRWMAGWVVYLGLFTINTALNLIGHIGPKSASTGQAA